MSGVLANLHQRFEVGQYYQLKRKEPKHLPDDFDLLSYKFLVESQRQLQNFKAIISLARLPFIVNWFFPKFRHVD